MSLRALQDYTFTSKYARYVPEKKRRETWSEAVERVRDMHIHRYPQIEEEITWAFEQIKQKRVLGSQRALQFGGAPIEKKNSRIYNCIASYCDRVRFFQECFWLLLCGCGTGFSVQQHHVAKLPELAIKRKSINKVYVIPDTIEGWADALGVLMSSYLKNGEFPDFEGYDVIFDYSLIRPEGAPLRSSSGKAPGPEPLRQSLEWVRKLLKRCVDRGQLRLRPIDCYDIVMFASEAVLSGGVRRSATICLFSPEDEEMAKAKTGNWRHENPQRGRSNNSAMLVRDETTREQFEQLMQWVREYGEPGFVWSDSRELLVNPCLTKDSVIATGKGLMTIKSLIGKQFLALVDGELHSSTNEGFWKTGTKDVVKLTFESGRTLRLTGNHKVMTTKGWKEAKDITADDSVVINNHRNLNVDQDSKSYAQGYCLGNFLGDGNVSKKSAEMKWWGGDQLEQRKNCLSLLEQAGWRSNNHKEDVDNNSTYSTIGSRLLYKFAEDKRCLSNGKQLTEESLEGNASYLAGLIAGYFDSDGTVLVNHQKGCSLRIPSSNLNNLRCLQIALNYLGITSNIYQERRPEGFRNLPDGKRGLKEYFCKANHELCISCDNIVRFASVVNLQNKDKHKKLTQLIEGYKRVPNRTSFVDKVIAITEDGTEEVYDCSIPGLNAFDANSVYVHNCGEIGLLGYSKRTGKSGWHACNLCEINGGKCKTADDFMIAAEAAAIIGTCQAGYTDFGYLGQTTKEIVEAEALLGVSITGMMDNPDVLFDAKLQRQVAKHILKVNERIAKKIGINPTARATCVKPAGTSSCVLGTASGIHAHHARYYFRLSQANHLEGPLRFYEQHNPLAVEKCVWGSGKDKVIYFCVEVPKGARTKNDVGAMDLLKLVLETQKNWVMAGRVQERCAEPFLCHNVSNTITVGEDEWDLVTKFIYDNRKYFAGVTLLPKSGDKDYPQAPFTAVHTPREIVQEYGDGSVMASGLIVDALHAFDNNLWVACDCVLGTGEPLEEPKEPENFDDDVVSFKSQMLYSEAMRIYKARKDWCRRAVQFADRYFDGDLRKMTYCLKDVSNWKLWCDLKREYQDVDYSQMVEERDDTKLAQEVACAGGSCEIQYA